MSGGYEQNRKRRPPKMFLMSTDLKVQDQLDGTIRLQRGFICLEQDSGKIPDDVIWVKVLDNGLMLKLERKLLFEIPAEFNGLLEPVADPEARLRLLHNPGKLQQLVSLPASAPLWVQIGLQDELAEAELRFIGPLPGGSSSAVLFGVELKGAAVGKGKGNGSFKGHRLFSCPESCALFLPVSHIRLRSWTRSNGPGPRDRDPQQRISSGNNHPGNGHHSNIERPNQHPQQQQQQQQQQQRHHGRHVSFHQHRPSNEPHRPSNEQHRPSNAPQQPQHILGILPRTAESAPLTAHNQVRRSTSPPPFHVGQRVCFPTDEAVHGGEVKYVGLLPGRPSSGMYVGVLLDAPVGNWDGSYKGEKLCHIPSPNYGILLPVTKVSPDRRSTSPPPFHMGQRVCFPTDEAVHGGEVKYVGLLPGRASSGMYVGVLLDAPVGNWDGSYKGEKLCHIPSPNYGTLLPVTKVSPEPKQRHNHFQYPNPALKPLPPPVSKPGPISPLPTSPKVALLPPNRPVLRPPPLPPPKPASKHIQLPPVPPPKPNSPTSLVEVAEPLQHGNGNHSPPSPLRLPGNDHEDSVFDGEEGVDGVEGDLEVGSMVEVNDPPLFGVIRWIGRISGISEPVAGIELDQELSAGTDGSYLGERHFRCSANKGLFVKLRNCRRDSRFPAPETPVNQVERCNSIAFAEWGSERVEEHTPPVDEDEARDLYEGWKRGIQGHLNSCYLDATLFSLFSCCSSADWVLLWPSEPETDSSQAQDLLRCEIVNPLRRYGYVCASKTMALRRLLEAANRNTGFTNQEKDPEEFLNKLFQLLKVEPLLKIRSMSHQPQQCHLYQLFPPTLPPSPSSPSPLSPGDSPIPTVSIPTSRMRVASVQTLLESSFLHSGLKFVEAPSCLLLLMPRFGKDFKMFDAILPSLSLDITDLLDDTLRQCSICQAIAEWECLQCYDDPDITPGHLKQYCHTCNTQVHSHRKRSSHGPLKVAVPGAGGEPWTGPLHSTRQRMSLFAVTCIETSHYVSFVKHGPQPTDWLFFDSMADREGGENGFNIPHVKACPEVGRYLGLSEEELRRVDASSLRESARRLLCDSYMCLYHSPELSLYK